jgi:hypothetical protein
MASNMVRYGGGGGSWIDKFRSNRSSGLARSGDRMTHTAVQVGEGAVVAAALGALNVKKGLDIKVSATLPKVPVDLSIGMVALVASMVTDINMSHHLRNVGTAAATIYAFRKTQDMMGASPSTVHGESDAMVGAEDPVVAAARLL